MRLKYFRDQQQQRAAEVAPNIHSTTNSAPNIRFHNASKALGNTTARSSVAASGKVSSAASGKVLSWGGGQLWPQKRITIDDFFGSSKKVEQSKFQRILRLGGHLGTKLNPL